MKKVLFSLLLAVVFVPITFGQAKTSRTIVTSDTTVCGSYTWINNETYTQDTVETYISGDTLYVLNLTVINTDFTSTPVVIERACSYNGRTESAIFDTTLTQINGCDSVIRINLTINPSAATDTAIVACDSVRFNGTLYTESITTTVPVTVGECTTNYNLTLTIKNSVYADTTEADGNCSYSWNNMTITDDEVHHFALTDSAANGCDSILSIHVTLTHTIYDTLTVTNCGSYTNWNRTFDETGAYDNTETTETCTTYTHLNLTVYPTTDTVEATACDQYTWNLNGNTYNTTGMRSIIVGDSVTGCDTRVTLDLTINYSPVVTIVGPHNVIPGESTILRAVSDDEDATYTYLWSYNGTTSTADSIELTNVTENTDVHLRSTNTVGGCVANNWITVTPYEGAGIDDINAIAVNIYPNPAVRIINIESAEAISQVVIYNALGQKVMTNSNSGNQMQLNLSNLANGNYTMQIVSFDGKQTSRKFIISK